MKIDLRNATAEKCVDAIIEMVEDIAENEDNWENADLNTPFTGDVAGMDIPSADIVSVSNDLKKIFCANGSSITITDEEANILATPGICVQFFMNKGYMKKNDEFLENVVSFGYISAAGVGYRIDKGLKSSSTRCKNWLKAISTANENTFRRLMAKASHGQSKAELASDDLDKLRSAISASRDYIELVQNPVELLALRQRDLAEKQRQYADMKAQFEAGDSNKNSVKVKMQKILPSLLVDREAAKTIGLPSPVDMENNTRLITHMQSSVDEAVEIQEKLEKAMSSL